MPRIQFSVHESTVHNAVVVSFDLGGFSDFCSQPTASVEAPQLMKHVFDLLDENLGEQDNWSSEPKSTVAGKLVEPHFIKFTGDGALMLWHVPRVKNIPQSFCNLVVQIMRNFQKQLLVQLPIWQKDRRVNKMPRQARFGIATGLVYALRPPHSFTTLTDPVDYVGYCINLAVRLQDHCPEAGFLVHGNLHPEVPGLKFLEAINMKGSQTEPVAIFSEDLARVSPSRLKLKFRDPI